MPFVIPTGHAQVRLIWTVQGLTDPINVTFGAVCQGVDAAADCAEAWYNAWVGGEGLIKPVSMAAGWTFQGVEVSQGSGDFAYTGSYLAPVVGTSAINPLPPNSALLVRKNTGAGGRRGRGRAFFPPCFFDEGSVNAAGTIDGSWITSHQPIFSGALTGLTASDFPPRLFHVDNTPPNIITGLSLQGTLATQRRRLR